MNDLEGMSNNPDRHQFLAVVSSVHHQGTGETLNNGALGLPEALDLVPARGVGQEFGVLLLDSNVILKENSF